MEKLSKNESFLRRFKLKTKKKILVFFFTQKKSTLNLCYLFRS